MDLVRVVNRITAPLRRRVLTMIGRAVLSAIDDSKKAQSLQITVLSDDVREDVERFGEYGLSSVPDKGCEAIVLFIGGNSGHGVVIATEDRRYRPTGLSAGEVCLYTKDDGKRVYLKVNGEVHLGTDPSDFVALAPATKSEISALRDTVNSLITAYNAHIHVTTATIGPSAAPGAIIATTSQATPPAAVGEVAATEVKAK